MHVARKPGSDFSLTDSILSVFEMNLKDKAKEPVVESCISPFVLTVCLR